MTTTYGVYAESDGEFWSTHCYSIAEAEAERVAMIAAADEDERADTAADLTVREMCADHLDDEQRADACELCDAEADDDGETEDDE